MHLQQLPPEADCHNWICPDLGAYWKLAKVQNSDKIILRSREANVQYQFSPAEGFALQHFTGKLTVRQIQQRCHKQFSDTLSPNFVAELLQKLMALGILDFDSSSPPSSPPSLAGKGAGGLGHFQHFLPPCEEWICPDITPYWKLSQLPDSDRIALKAIEGNLRVLFSAAEGCALRYFTGKFTVSQVQNLCQQQFGADISPDFIAQLLQKLVELNILELPAPAVGAVPPCPPPPAPALQNKGGSPNLKSCVQWIEHPEGYWILRNPEDVTFLQVSDFDKAIVDELGSQNIGAIASQFSIPPDYIKQLLQMLTATAMLEGTTPPKPPKRKFTPMQLLSFRVRLFNPDPFLTRTIDNLRWIWTRPSALILLTFLAFSAAFGLNHRETILHAGQQLLVAYGGNLFIPFALLSVLVVSLHELGHAFTLKNYNGIVPEIGLLIIMFVPAAYTNTTDSYCLSRFKRVLVVGAGILVQLIIWAVALWLWMFTIPGNWLHDTSYLLMAAALFTVALNLNPLAKFDGYYLASAISGINNLRSRAFGLYANLLRGKPIHETPGDALFLAIYAPFSLAYIYFVFGFLLLRIADWTLSNIPTTALILLTIWAIYFYFPSKKTN